MAALISEKIKSLQTYLTQPSERNEDLAINYFRSLFTDFDRQSDAQNADGYVKGHFVLELKGDTKDWYKALFQGCAYATKGLAFSLVVVACKHFLGIWSIDTIPVEVRDYITSLDGKSPSKIGELTAQKFKGLKNIILRDALWYKPEIFTSLFSDDSKFAASIREFEVVLRRGRKQRVPISLKNFVQKLDEMKPFFDPKTPIKTVRAFYAMIYGPWDESSSVYLDPRFSDRATIGGVQITDLLPSKRQAFKQFAESHYISLAPDENNDDFFAHFDQAIDRVDRDFRVKHGIFFTDLDLSKFAMWFVKRKLADLGNNYLVIDPACGSGNLVTNWKSPLELRHKVVSELEPELLYAVENRMKGDAWHDGKFTVVPKTSENKGLNFLDCSASEYLDVLKVYLAEKGHRPDKPLAFLCNPPYRSDDDQAAQKINYKIHPSIIELTGSDASSERYAAFLAQMKLICQKAETSGFPGKSVLLLFTKAAWLHQRQVLEQIRREILGTFDFVDGFLVNSKEFFKVKVEFPIAFSIWRFEGNEALNADRPITMHDLTWLKRSNLDSIDWQTPSIRDTQCEALLSDEQTVHVALGKKRQRMLEWCGQKRIDFMRNRNNSEVGTACGGLPRGDRRLRNKKAYGDANAPGIGFMDDRTPCRTQKAVGGNGYPWFRLNAQFMDVKRNRLFSGPADNRSYCARTADEARRLFLWYALARTFAFCKYPLWLDNAELWPVEAASEKYTKAIHFSLAIAFAENECTSIVFPADNPVAGAPQVRVFNPMTPLRSDSFWCQILAPIMSACDSGTSPANLISVVNEYYSIWRKRLKGKRQIEVDFEASYLVDSNILYDDAGIVQIRDYAEATADNELIAAYQKMQDVLKTTKREFYSFLVSEHGIDYFGTMGGAPEQSPTLFAPSSQFEQIVEKRLALAGFLVHKLSKDKHFGRTKLQKLFYIADTSLELKLKTEYTRAAAGPLDQRCLYNKKIGVEAIAQKYQYFAPREAGKAIRYEPLVNMRNLVARAEFLFATDLDELNRLVKLFRPMTTEQAEIVATLYACWKDLLLEEKQVTDKLVIQEFLRKWHEKKQRFAKDRLEKALDWMRVNGLVPTKSGRHTILMRD